MNQPEDTQSDRRRPWAFWLGFALLATVGAAALVRFAASPSAANEAAAAERLKGMRALVVQDSRREHVASLNLSTLRSEEDQAEAFELLADLPYLTALDISGLAPTSEQLDVVASLGRLQSLTANRVALTDDDLAQIGRLSRLESFNATGARVEGTRLQSLAGLGELRVLNLAGSEVSGGLGVLAALPKLNWLVLSDCEIEDDSLAHLADAPNLSRLTLTGSRYPEASLERLRRSNPGIQIDSGPREPTAEESQPETASVDESEQDES